MTEQFNGFDQNFWQFFSTLKHNNNREWFAVNKDRYHNHVVAPISAFIADIAPALQEISPHYNADPRPHKGSMFRIYRDVRFAKDGKPYKEHAAVQFRHRLGKDAHAPGFYVHLEEGNIRYGGGIWVPPSDVLLKIRERIAYYPEKWQSVIEDKDFIKNFKTIRGDSLIRPPRGFDASNPHIEDIKRKSFFAMKEGTLASAKSADFVDEVIESFEAASPLMCFISDAVDVAF
ncbi:MAG: DUF2461 domain-containing protein [Emcibacter sp.]|nr:DUF2461 domain-containing protein [Emcibacter sp.]